MCTKHKELRQLLIDEQERLEDESARRSQSNLERMARLASNSRYLSIVYACLNNFFGVFIDHVMFVDQ